MINKLWDLNRAGMFRGIVTSTAALKTEDKTLENIDALLEEFKED